MYRKRSFQPSLFLIKRTTYVANSNVSVNAKIQELKRVVNEVYNYPYF